MAHGADETLAPWGLPGDGEARPPLAADLRTEVCIVGAGVAGLSVAYRLARHGRRVVVLEAGAVGSGESGRSTAHLSSAVDDGWGALERLFGPEATRQVAASHAAAVDFIERTVAEEGIDCGFARLDAYLFNPPGGGLPLPAECAAAVRAGLAAELVGRAPLDAVDTGPAVRFADQGRLDPLAYARGLARALVRLGGQLFTGTPVAEVASGRPARVTTVRGWHVLAEAVVVATNVPVNDRLVIHGKQAPMRTYVVAGPADMAGAADALYWDTADPYHYARFQPRPDGPPILIVGGEDHRTGHPADGNAKWNRLEAWARERFPGFGPVRWRWSGQVMEPADRLHFIGRNPVDEEGVFVATGDSGDGITGGTLAGLVIADLIEGRDNPWPRLYDPARLTLKAASGYADTNLHVAEHYADWLTAGDVDDVARIAPGSGAVIRSGLSKQAVYRDESGVLHRLSAVCPHLKCIVAWNEAEHSWDCACHGSRFDRWGRVVNGPANQPLPPADG
ncbi:MAG: FAD-dependent oxidoreductase [Actinomycetota bacterium]